MNRRSLFRLLAGALAAPAGLLALREEAPILVSDALPGGDIVHGSHRLTASLLRGEQELIEFLRPLEKQIRFVGAKLAAGARYPWLDEPDLQKRNQLFLEYRGWMRTYTKLAAQRARIIGLSV